MFAMSAGYTVKNVTMKHFMNKPALYLRLLLVLLTASLLFAATAVADVREDAEAAVSNLHRSNAAEKFPDDMKSIDSVIELARGYVASNDLGAADIQFLLALQKSRILEAKLALPNVAPLPEVPAPTLPPDSQPPVDDVPEHDMTKAPDSSWLVGVRGVYTVAKADKLRLVAAKLGVTQQHLRSMNGLDGKAYLKIGQKLAYNNRKIIPQQISDGIIINIPDRTLYFFQQGALITSLPVALGSVVKNEKYVWQTPVGKFTVTAKLKDPTWTVPPSIQAEMEEQGKEVILSIPPGPENPLGKYAIKISIPGILIHSTIRPASIYSFSSHGCIRISPDRMEGFFPQVKVNTRGEIIYKPVKLAVTEDGRVFLEAHRDVYNKSTSALAEVKVMLEKRKLTELVDWNKLKSVLQQKSGIAEDISL